MNEESSVLLGLNEVEGTKAPPFLRYFDRKYPNRMKSIHAIIVLAQAKLPNSLLK